MRRWILWTAGLLMSLGVFGWGGIQSGGAVAAKPFYATTATPLASLTPLKRPVISAENVDQLEVVGHVGRGGAGQAIWAGDGQHIAVTSDTGMWWHDLNNLDAPPRQLGTEGYRYAVASSADGKILAWPHDWDATVWNTVTGKVQVKFSLQNKPDQTSLNDVVVSADGSVVIFSDTFYSLYVVNTRTGAYFEVPNRAPSSMTVESPGNALSPDGSLFAIADSIKGLLLFQATTPEFAPVELGSPNPDATSVGFNGDSTQLAIGYENGAVWVENVATHRPVYQMKGRGTPVTAVTFSPDNRQLLVVHQGGLAELWDMNTGTLRLSIPYAHKWDGQGLFSPDGKFILFTGVYGVPQLWNVATGQLHATLQDAGGAVFSPDGKTLAGAYRGTIGLWDVGTGQLLHTLPGYDARVFAAISPDGRSIATIDAYEQVSIRAVETGLESAHWQLPAERHSMAMIFGADSYTLIIGDQDGQVRLWDISTHQIKRTFVTRTGIWNVALSADGQLLAAACPGGLFVWNAVTGERLWVASDSYRSVSFGGGGKLLAALTEQGSGQVWDVAAHTLSSTLPVFVPLSCEYCDVRGIAFFAFMPDGKTLAYSADSQTIKLRDVQTGYDYPQGTFCDGDLLNVTFSADSKLIGMACMGSHYHSFGQLEAFTPNGAESIGLYGGVFGFLERTFIGELLFDPSGTYLLVDRLWLFGIALQ